MAAASRAGGALTARQLFAAQAKGVVAGGSIAGGAFGVGQHMEQARGTAAKYGLGAEETARAVRQGILPGILEGIPAGQLISRAGRPIFDVLGRSSARVKRLLAKADTTRTGRAVAHAAEQSVEEGLQEGASAILQNRIEQGLGGDVALFHSVMHQALVGATVGSILGGGFGALQKPPGQQTKPEQTKSEQAKSQESEDSQEPEDPDALDLEAFLNWEEKNQQDQQEQTDQQAQTDQQTQTQTTEEDAATIESDRTSPWYALPEPVQKAIESVYELARRAGNRMDEVFLLSLPQGYLQDAATAESVMSMLGQYREIALNLLKSGETDIPSFVEWLTATSQEESFATTPEGWVMARLAQTLLEGPSLDAAPQFLDKLWEDVGPSATLEDFATVAAANAGLGNLDAVLAIFDAIHNSSASAEAKFRMAALVAGLVYTGRSNPRQMLQDILDTPYFNGADYGVADGLVRDVLAALHNFVPRHGIYQGEETIYDWLIPPPGEHEAPFPGRENMEQTSDQQDVSDTAKESLEDDPPPEDDPEDTPDDDPGDDGPPQGDPDDRPPPETDTSWYDPTNRSMGRHT